MDFMKVIDQTVREIKREVNLKVLKVPEIEQKVLDATDNEPWGPHGSALAEIAQATKKFTECQMVMNVLWTRLVETGKDWRYVYKALAVIEYLVSHGSERAVDDIIEHSFQISSLTSFEYFEPSGKDLGINVRKKAENIGALLNNREKIQEVRNKAAASRDKYIGLSSSGVTYKSGAASFGSGSYQSSGRYEDFTGSRDGDRFGGSYKDKDQYGEGKIDKETYGKSHQGATSEILVNTSKKGSTRFGSKYKDDASSNTTKSNDADKHSSVPSQMENVPSNNNDADFDNFDPRGTSSAHSATASSNQVDLFGGSLGGDLFDTPTSAPQSAMNSNSSEVDLFADATFVLAPPHKQTGASSQTTTEIDLFSSQSAIPSVPLSTVDLFATPSFGVQPEAVPSVPLSTVDLFATPSFGVQPEAKAPKPDFTDTNIVDPFSAVPLNNFDGSDSFGEFTSHSGSTATESLQNPSNSGSLNNLSGRTSTETPPKKGSFQVKSGIWADSLSRGLIDLNISAPKKVSLADVGVVGGLSDGSDEREKGPTTSLHLGRAINSGYGLGRSGVTSSQAMSGDDFLLNLSSEDNQFGNWKK
ncbi:ENTH domain-containing protein [Cephalotus follicularis]|uniref:ENTH domain-containing protein n=1 Tax=Cephalotus follicularis TaxID=3775 RepID=A0A1Q3AMJ4_CEPFO|nr:ENTH domain-containing protein [Cephalotus follicularis]